MKTSAAFSLRHVVYKRARRSVGNHALVSYLSGRMFGGLVNDIRRKAPHYVSDYKDGISIQVRTYCSTVQI